MELPPARYPVWILRQASRYLPEYRELRDRVAYREICTTPEHAADATVQPVRRFGLDAGSLFRRSPARTGAAGRRGWPSPDEGPRVSDPIRSRLGMERLRSDDDVGQSFLPAVARAAYESLGGHARWSRLRAHRSRWRGFSSKGGARSATGI